MNAELPELPLLRNCSALPYLLFMVYSARQILHGHVLSNIDTVLERSEKEGRKEKGRKLITSKTTDCSCSHVAKDSL